MNTYRKLGNAGRVLVISLVCLVEIYPLFWLITASLKTPTEWSTKPAYALNEGFYFQNYIDAWTRGNIALYFKNSLITTLVSLVFIVFFSATVGFAVTKMDWKYKDKVAQYFRIGIMVPVATALMPLFQMYNKMNLIDTRMSLIISYIAFGLSLSIYLVQSYLRSFPDELLEASVIDGCNIYQMFYHVAAPLMKNALITVLVLQFFFKWNDLLFSMTFISDSSLKTIQTGLLYFSDEFGAKNWGAIFASISITVFPMLILYTVLNKKIIEGMTAGAVKG